MNRWLARFLAFVVAAAAIYLVVANVHGATAALESALGAAVLATATFVLLWKRPQAALLLNVVWLAGAFAASAWLSSSHRLPNLIASPPSQAEPSPVAIPQAGAPSASIAAEAKRLGSDPKALLTRVSDGVRLEVYPGAFRGAAATLADGAGNDVDKALLLHDLVRAANPNANLRYATCTLTPQQADAVIASAVNAYRPPYVIAQFAGDVANDPTTSPKAKAFLTRIASAWSDIVTQAKNGTTTLNGQLQGANVPVKTLSAQDVRPFVTTHVWLQQQTPPGWIDLDPSVPHAAPGSSICAAGQTTADLPAHEFVSVTLRVHAESRKNGDQTLMQQTWPATGLEDKTLAFMFAEPTDTKVNVPAAVPSGMVAYTPVIRAGDAVFTGTPLILPLPARANGPGIGALAAKGPSGALTAFGTPAPTPSPISTPIPVDVSAVWLQVTVSAPNAKAQTVDSPIFDSVSFADRSAGRAASAQFAPIEQSSGVYLPLAAIWNVSVTEGSAIAGVGDRAKLDTKAPDAATLASALGRVQRNYYRTRPVLFALTASPVVPIVNAQPSIGLAGFVWHAGAKPGSESAAIVLDRANDNAISLGRSATDTVALGVSSLLAERYAAGAPNMIAHRADRVGGNDVLTVFDWAPKENVATIAVRSTGDLTGLRAPDDAKARVGAAIADGTVAYVPNNVVKLSDANDYYGWWNVRPDGSVLDEMQNGRHQDEAAGEAQVDEDILVKVSKFFRRQGGIVRCAVAAAAISGASVEGGAEGAAEWAHAEYEIEKDKDEIQAIAEGAADDQEMAEVCSE
ncbi:MAG TPA: hypothetical protein VFE36_02190 [Candidatus Baltobacteraceae bacterium]|jgi:hypothetical protein|nr:hypothetical protein [Candidatus Baltobacteraceae bacterium]